MSGLLSNFPVSAGLALDGLLNNAVRPGEKMAPDRFQDEFLVRFARRVETLSAPYRPKGGRLTFSSAGAR